MNTEEIQALRDNLDNLESMALSTANAWNRRALLVVNGMKVSDKRRAITKNALRIKSTSHSYDTVDDFNGEQISVSYEYNTSCHCHPEYETVTFSFPAAWIGLGDDLDAVIDKEIDGITKELMDQFAKEDAKAVEDAKARQIAQEQKDRETYERLKGRFEGNGTPNDQVQG
jgi:hypothetical protein